MYALTSAVNGTCLGEFRGKIISVAEAKEQAQAGNEYLFEVHGQGTGKVLHVIDAQDPTTASWTRCVNAADCTAEQNTAFVQMQGKIYLKAIKAITAGDELLAWYGKDTGIIIKPAPKGSAKHAVSKTLAGAQSAGVSWDRYCEKWRACITYQGGRKTLVGHYTTKARAVYGRAAALAKQAGAVPQNRLASNLSTVKAANVASKRVDARGVQCVCGKQVAGGSALVGHRSKCKMARAPACPESETGACDDKGRPLKRKHAALVIDGERDVADSKTMWNSGYRGVKWNHRHRKWWAQITVSAATTVTICVGIFENEEDAARAHDAECTKRGLLGQLNRADSRTQLCGRRQ